MPYMPCAGGCGKEIKTRVGTRIQKYCGDPCVGPPTKKEPKPKRTPRATAQRRDADEDESLDLGE